jgi:hypothetical protein
MVSATTYGDLGAVGPERTGSWEGGEGGFGLEHATRREADASIATKERDELLGFIVVRAAVSVIRGISSSFRTAHGAR